jgi:hypothetical protein
VHTSKFLTNPASTKVKDKGYNLKNLSTRFPAHPRPRARQDLQQASTAAGGPGPKPGLLWGELAELADELGADLEADWLAAEEVLTTTGRAKKEGGQAQLMPRPRHPGVSKPQGYSIGVASVWTTSNAALACVAPRGGVGCSGGCEQTRQPIRQLL